MCLKCQLSGGRALEFIEQPAMLAYLVTQASDRPCLKTRKMVSEEQYPWPL